MLSIASLRSSATRAWHDPFFRKSAVFFAGSMFVAFLNYLYYPVLGRWLSLSDFGDVQALLALSTEMSMVLGAFTLATVHASVNCEDAQECAAIVKTLRTCALAVVGVFFLLLLVSARSLATTFHFTGPSLFIALAILLITTTVYSIRLGVLQGKGRFGSVSVGNMLVAGGRLTFAVLLVWLGFRAFGAIAGLVLAQLVALLFVTWKTRTTLTVSAEETPFLLTKTRVWCELRYVAQAAATMAFITALYTADILVVKHYFAPEIAGVYSGISAVAKIAFFVTSPIAAVLLSSVKRRDTRAHRREAVLKAAGLVSVLGGGFLLCVSLAPQLFIRLMMGARYSSQAFLLPWLSAAFFGAAVANVFFYLGLALQRKRLLAVAGSGSLLLISLILWRHDTLLQIAHAFTLVAWLTAACALVSLSPDIRVPSEERS
jgi:O-antigen/teichoic acid export membrane protein